MLTNVIKMLFTIIDVPLYFVWNLIGWNNDNNLPDEDKFMLVMGYHTSFHDYYHSIPVAIRERRRPRIMMKQELLDNPWYGWFLKLGGGFGVDRSRSQNTVETIVNDIEKEDRLVIIIAPEGTRQQTDDWKTGFYHIAVGADLPLVLVYVDYERKRVGFSELYHPTGDIVQDFQWIRDFFAEHGSPRFPDQFALPDIDKIRARVAEREQTNAPQQAVEDMHIEQPIVTP